MSSTKRETGPADGRVRVGSLGFALLGLLARGPKSGYDLKRAMQRPVGYFWTASHGQIYPELGRLERAGLVSHELVEQSGRPDKKVYEATAAGVEALRRWATAATAPRAVRDELVLKAYSVWLADPAEARDLFREHERLHEERLARYKETKRSMERERADDLRRPDSPAFASLAAVQRGIIHERGYAEWCRWMAERLDAGGG